MACARTPCAADRPPGPERSFFCVGDVKQAIYGWRGGVPQIFDALATNCHDVSANISRKLPFVPSRDRNGQPGLSGHANIPALDREQTAVRPVERPVSRTFKRSRSDLAGYACLVDRSGRKRTIYRPRKPNTAVAADTWPRLLGQAPGFSIGVLARRERDGGTIDPSTSRQIGIHASQEGGNPLTDSAAVQLILALLKLADHPGDTAARFHLANSPLAAGLGVGSHEDGDRRSGVDANVRQTLIRPRVRTGALSLGRDCWRQLRSLARPAGSPAGGVGLRLSGTRHDPSRRFVQLVKTQRVADPSTADVRVMTLHQAKGLEFDLVVLPGSGHETDRATRRLCGSPRPADRSGPASVATPVPKFKRSCPTISRQMFRDAAERESTNRVRAVRRPHPRRPRPAHDHRPIEQVREETAAHLGRAAAGGMSDGNPLPAKTFIFETWPARLVCGIGYGRGPCHGERGGRHPARAPGRRPARGLAQRRPKRPDRVKSLTLGGWSASGNWPIGWASAPRTACSTAR